MKTRILIITALSTCLLATQALAIQIKPASKNSNASWSTPISNLMGKLSKVNITSLGFGANPFVSSQGKKQNIPGGFVALPNKSKYPGSGSAGGCRKNCSPQASVPEPSTIALLGTGLLLVGFSQRRKAHATSAKQK